MGEKNMVCNDFGWKQGTRFLGMPGYSYEAGGYSYTRLDRVN